MRAWLLAALAMLPTQALALTSTCNQYVARDAPTVKFKEDAQTFTVSFERYEETYMKVITKTFGMLIEGGIEKNGTPNPRQHYLIRENLQGIPTIILDSIIFVPDCDAK